MQNCTLICIHKIQGNRLVEEKYDMIKIWKKKIYSAVVTRWTSRRRYGLIRPSIWYNENQWIENIYREKFSFKFNLLTSLQRIEFELFKENKLVCGENDLFTKAFKK